MLRKTVLSICALILSVAAVFIGLELFLWSAWKITGNWRFTNQGAPANVQSAYPENPDAYFKIAIFGGSAANGYNAERGFAEIMNHELNGAYPGKKFYVKKYAENGRPFHRYEAELARQALPLYDLIIVYAGTNEELNYVNDSLYFIKESFRDKKLDLNGTPVVEELLLRKFSYRASKRIQSDSRLFAMLKRLTQKKGDSANYYRPVHFKDIESVPLLPETEVATLIENYRADVNDLAKRVQESGKQMLIITEVTQDSMGPVFSYFNANVSEPARATAAKNYRAARHLVEEGHCSAAKPLLDSVLKADADFAGAHYLSGRCALTVKKWDAAHTHFRAAIDHDGFLMRSITPLFMAAKSTATRYENSTRFVDATVTFQSLIRQGLPETELFSDLQHPSIQGHTLLARPILCALSKTRGLENATLEARFCGEVTPESLASAAKEYASKLGVSADARTYQYYMSARYNISSGSRASNSEEYFELAEKQLQRYLESSPKEPRYHSTASLYRFLIEGLRGKDLPKALALLNDAYKNSPAETLEATQNGSFATGEALQDVMQRLNIYFEPSAKEFKLKSP